MKFHFDPYVKNWKRKSTPTEPDAKKAKIEENEETNTETLDEAEEDLEKEIEEHIHDEIKGNYWKFNIVLMANKNVSHFDLNVEKAGKYYHKIML